MAVIIFTASQQRLEVRGPCLEADQRHLVDALEAFGRTTPALVLDLRRVSVMSWAVAESVLLACERMGRRGVQVQLRMKATSPVDRMVEAVRDSLGLLPVARPTSLNRA